MATLYAQKWSMVPRLVEFFRDSVTEVDQLSLSATLKIGTLAFEQLDQAYTQWRKGVFSGEISSDEEVAEDEASFRSWFNEWVEVADRLHRVVSDPASLRADHADEVGALVPLFLEARETANATLDGWRTPQLSTNPAFRKVRLSDSERAKMRELLAKEECRIPHANPRGNQGHQISACD